MLQHVHFVLYYILREKNSTYKSSAVVGYISDISQITLPVWASCRVVMLRYARGDVSVKLSSGDTEFSPTIAVVIIE